MTNRNLKVAGGSFLFGSFASMGIKQPSSLNPDATKLKRGFSNLITLSTSLVFLLNNITLLGISFFLSTIIGAIYPGRTTV
jgi:hypothetical protein